MQAHIKQKHMQTNYQNDYYGGREMWVESGLKQQGGKKEERRKNFWRNRGNKGGAYINLNSIVLRIWV